ncbi:hypothetical protein O0L34_g12065 [Tuta absoluta]|nr:hypothetical protein O0L34_g12065 [Tuta absoluta]
MKIVLISGLLFFEICTAISLHKIQTEKSQPTPENLTDVYEIEEGDKKTVRFVYPKSEKPTLREITYFHVKETPYPDVDNYEYETKLLLTGEVGDITGEGVLEEDGEDLLPIEEEEEYADALEEVAELEISTTNTPNLKKTTMASSNGSIKSTTNSPKDIKTSTISTDIDKMEVTTEATTTEEPNTMLNSITSDKEKINARNRLFTQAREKYLHKKQEKPSPRHKREISPDDFPPAPTLPPLDLSILPDDVRMLISSTPTPETTYSKQKEPEISNEDTLKEDLRQKLNDMISLLRQNRDGEGNNNDDDDKENENKTDEEDSNEEEVGDDNDEETYEDGADDYWDDVEHEIDEDTKVRKARTFGMNLSNGRGYVWNDLLGEPDMPGMSFDVGEPQDDSLNNKPNTDDKKPDDDKASDDKKPEFTDKITETKPFSTAPVDHVHYSAESRPIYMSDDNKESDRKDETNPHEVTSNKDLEDIEITTNKLRLLPIENDSMEKHTTDDFIAESKKPNEKESAIKKGHKKKHEKAIKKSENDDLFKELMKNEQFWKWLSDWTATYMELLMKHIKDVVEDEVASQMKTLASKLKKHLQKQASDEAQKIKKPMQESNLDKLKDTDVISIDGKEVLITRTTNFDAAGEKKSLHKNSKKEHKKPKADHKNPKGGHKKPMEEHKESNKEHNNTDASKHKGEKDKRKEHATHDFHKESNKNRSPTSIRAQNIFGNVVGSDKVTNIFVFYPEDDEDGDENFEENVQPLINGANNVFTFGSGEVEIDKKHPQITGFKDESTMTDNKTQTTIKPDNNNKNVTLNENKEQKESKNREELHPGSTTTTPKGDISKIENTSDKKESDPTPPAKEDETKTIKPEVVGNDDHKDSSANDKGTALENKDDKDAKDKKAEKTKDNDNASKAESTTPISPIIEDKEKKTSKQEEKDTEAEKIKDIEVTESNTSKTETTTPSLTITKDEEKKSEDLNEKNTTSKEEDKTKESEKESSKDNQIKME